MQNFEAIFDNRSFDTNKLLSFGFTKMEDGYLYSCPLSEKQFELKIIISENGNISVDVIDIETQEIYALIKVEAATGPFLGKLRSECGALLAEIDEKCFFADTFKNSVTKKIIAYVKNKYGDELEFLWPKFPLNAIFRRKDNRKWYAAILNLPKHKLGLDGNEKIDIIDLRIASTEIDDVIDGRRYFPGYHMNKKHWITICLDGSVPLEEIYERIDSSFHLALK